MTFWSNVRWRSLTPSECPVRPFDPSRIEEASYRLSVGREVYISASGGESRIHQLPQEEAFILKPGQFAFILTEEDVCLSTKIIGFISIRASIKFYGLVNVSGFHVDPGYSGKLIFAVFNAGPTNIHLRRGEEIFNIWISDLDQEINQTDRGEGYQSIPSKIVNQISGQFLTAYELVERIEKLTNRIESEHSEFLKTREDVEKLKAFNFRMKIVTGVAGTAILLVLGIVFKSLLADMFSEIRQHMLPAVKTEAATPSADGIPQGVERTIP